MPKFAASTISLNYEVLSFKLLILKKYVGFFKGERKFLPFADI